MKIVRGSDIENVLSSQLRVYLCGDLEWDTGLEHVPTDGFEIGISDYKCFTFEKAHLHSFNREYNYVLEGQVKIFLLSEKREYLFEKGDLFVIDTYEPYVGKSTEGTRTIFAKVPGGNDKVLVPMDEALIAWGRTWEAEYEENDLK